MSKHVQILDFERPLSKQERNSLTTQRDQLVIMAICRYLGRTDWEMDDAMWARGKWIEYADGELVFHMDNNELLLLKPPHYDRESNEWRQGYQWLFDIKDYKHHTLEDERG